VQTPWLSVAVLVTFAWCRGGRLSVLYSPGHVEAAVAAGVDDDAVEHVAGDLVV
jgi:hypothetical protein